MKENHITVVYKWNAKEGQLDTLTSIYQLVAEAMKANEPGAETVHVYASVAEQALYVRDEFTDADALAFHLQKTAAAHFPDLLAIANPGVFYFMGDVPEPLKQATAQMGLKAEFSDHVAGFDR